MDMTTELTDYMHFQDLLDDEEKLVRQTARTFVNHQVLPIIDKHAQDETFPGHLVPIMAKLGFFGPTLPVEYGGAGLSPVAYGLLMYELERGDSALRSLASVQGALVMYPIFTYGSEAHRGAEPPENRFDGTVQRENFRRFLARGCRPRARHHVDRARCRRP